MALMWGRKRLLYKRDQVGSIEPKEKNIICRLYFITHISLASIPLRAKLIIPKMGKKIKEKTKKKLAVMNWTMATISITTIIIIIKEKGIKITYDINYWPIINARGWIFIAGTQMENIIYVLKPFNSWMMLWINLGRCSHQK